MATNMEIKNHYDAIAQRFFVVSINADIIFKNN